MTIRRALIFTALLAGGTLAASGQVVEWSGASSASQQFPNFPISCALPSNTLTPVPTCIALGQNFSETMIVTPNQGVPFTWSSGTLPHGLNIDSSSGMILGTPDRAGVYSFVITATHSQTVYNSTVYTMVVGTGTVPNLPTITHTPLPTTAVSLTPVPSNWYTAAATGGYPCVTSFTINLADCSVNGLTPYYTWSFSGNSFGFVINPTTGAITGTPNSGGLLPLTVQASDGLGQNALSWSTQVNVGGAATFLITTPSPLTSGVVGTSYTATINTQGGPSTGTISWSVVSGNPPPGLGTTCTPSGSPTGTTCIFSGTPTIAGTYNFSLQASYNNGTPVSSNIQPYTLVIAQASGVTLALPVPAPQSVALGQSVTMTFAATGGTSPYIYATTPLFGSFPPGLTMNGATGVLSGTTTAVGTYNFTVEVTDNAGAHASAASSVAVGNTLALPQPASQTAVIGQTVNMTFAATGGTGSYTYTLISGSLPPNLSLNSSTGVISGTIVAPASGTYTFTIQVKDASNNLATAQSSITVSGLSMAAPSGVTVAAGLSATLQFTATGGTSPYTYSIAGVTYNGGSITVPSGLTISSSSGLVTFATTGATAAGAYVVTVQATDSASQTVTAQGSITVGAGSLTLPTPTAISGLVGQSVTMQFTAAGGTTPYTYQLTSGALPPGLALTTSTGTVTGTATAAGTYTFTIKVTDASSSTATATGSITITAALTMPSPATVTGVNNQTLTDQFTATGGTSPYTYSILSVTLNGSTITAPSQLTINSATGLVSFATTSATLAGSYVITVQAKDSASPQGTVSAPGTITIGPALTMPNPAAITNAVVGQSVSMQFTASGGTLPYTYAFVGGTLPQGLNLNITTGLLSGVPTAQGNYGFTIQATDSAATPLTATAQGSIVLTNLSLNNSNVTISLAGAGGSGIPAATQQPVTLSIAAALSQDISGTLAVNFQRTFDSLGSREIAFTNGASVIPFTIAHGQTQAAFQTTGGTVSLQVGTAAGSGSLTATFKDSVGNNITPPTLQPVIFSVAAGVPVINCPNCGFKLSLPVANTGSTPGGTYTATIVGYSSTLSMSTATFNFTATSGTQLSTTSVTVQLGTAFSQWYGNSGSNQTGGQFRLTIPLTFTVSGGSQSNPVAAATVTLTNSQGSVTSGSVNPQ